jgi:hypothetical protein
MTSDDMPALEAWLEQQALDAHNKEASERGSFGNHNAAQIARGEKRAYNAVLSKIRSGRINQRPTQQYADFCEGYR